MKVARWIAGSSAVGNVGWRPNPHPDRRLKSCGIDPVRLEVFDKELFEKSRIEACLPRSEKRRLKAERQRSRKKKQGKDGNDLNSILAYGKSQSMISTPAPVGPLQPFKADGVVRRPVTTPCSQLSEWMERHTEDSTEKFLENKMAAAQLEQDSLEEAR
jgi:hypothetical protein